MDRSTKGRKLRSALAVVVFTVLVMFLIRDASIKIFAWSAIPLPLRGLLFFTSELVCVYIAAFAAVTGLFGARWWRDPSRAFGCSPEEMKRWLVALGVATFCLCIPIAISRTSAYDPAQQYLRLLNAIKAHDAAGVKTQLTIGTDPNNYPKDNDPYNHPIPLNAAVVGGDIAIANALLDSGADIDRQDIWYSTPLAKAAEAGDLEMIRLLLRRGAKINDYRDGSSALLRAVYSEHPTCVQYLLVHGANPDTRSLGITGKMVPLLEDLPNTSDAFCLSRLYLTQAKQRRIATDEKGQVR